MENIYDQHKPKGCREPHKMCSYVKGGIIGELCDYCKENEDYTEIKEGCVNIKGFDEDMNELEPKIITK